MGTKVFAASDDCFNKRSLNNSASPKMNSFYFIYDCDVEYIQLCIKFCRPTRRMLE